MTRKEGFIEVDKMLQELGVDTMSLQTIMESPLITVIDGNTHDIVLSFCYHNEIYFYKYSNIKYIDPYNELVAEELAKDYGISCANYDLAILNSKKGVLSKNLKKNDVTYISGDDLIINARKDTHIRSFHTLEGVWDSLEYRYYHYTNKRDIISHLMKKIVDIYLFDIILCHCDRHSQNWMIMENGSTVDIAPIYDNERILAISGDEADLSLCMYSNGWTDYENLWKSIRSFQGASSENYRNIIKEKLWIIGEENLGKVFERVEKKTGYPMPEERKNFYLSNYQEHKKRLEEVLEKEDTRKR